MFVRQTKNFFTSYFAIKSNIAVNIFFNNYSSNTNMKIEHFQTISNEDFNSSETENLINDRPMFPIGDNFQYIKVLNLILHILKV